MRCKDIERLIIDSSDEALSLEKLSAIEAHIAHCALCARFQDDLEKIRIGVKAMPQPALSPDLAQKTRVRCHAEISQKPMAASKIARLIPSYPIPKYVWAVLLFTEIRWDQSLTFTSVVALSIIIQNALMLLLAPILIRRRRWNKQSVRGIPMNANAS
jgi:hypothetical protein